MSTIDLIVLGMIKEKEQSAYDLQKMLSTEIFLNGLKSALRQFIKK
ncbi:MULTISPECIES: hypothetical protein [Terrabacteria group]|nr:MULTISPECIES: hypothetical protein [Terrabacteria group]MBW9213024.1 hypothetical protein [Trueperella sp. zg.1013]